MVTSAEKLDAHKFDGIQRLQGDTFIRNSKVLEEFKMFQEYRVELIGYLEANHPEEFI